MDRTTRFAAMAVAAASFGFAAQADDPAPRVDPPRWSVPADTPEQKYAVAMQEAGAAMNEALKECRALHAAASAERKSCEAAAREQWKQETREARRHLLNDNTPSR